jgi:hypothetical protein
MTATTLEHKLAVDLTCIVALLIAGDALFADSRDDPCRAFGFNSAR